MRRGIAASPLATYSAGLISRNSQLSGVGNRLYIESFNRDRPLAREAPLVASDFFFDQRPEVAAVAGWRIARAGAITTGSTQDFTVPGIGTPAAALVVVTGSLGTFGSPVNDKRISVGIKTSGFEGGISGSSQDAHSGSVTHNSGFTDALVKVIKGDGSAFEAVATGALITDGIRLTWSTLPPNAFITDVMLFFGPDISVDADLVTSPGAGTTTITAGFAPDVLLCLSDVNTFDNNIHVQCTLEFFLGVREGDARYTYWSQNPDSVGTSLSQLVTLDPNAIAADFSEAASPAFIFAAETFFDSWNATGFAVNSIGGTPPFCYLALRFGGKAVYSSILDTPAATGDASYSGSGMTPAYAMTLMSRLGTLPSNNKTGRAGAAGLSAFNAAGEQFAASVTDQDAQTTTNTSSIEAAKAYYLTTDAAAEENTATFVSFEPNKFTLNWSAAVGSMHFITLLLERDWHLASGTPSFRIPTASGVGELVFSAAASGTPSGAPKFPKATGTGTGQLIFKATGAGTFPLAQGAGASLLEFSATGAGSFAVPTGTGAGTLEFTSTGSGSFPLAQGAGASLLEFTGTSAGVFPLAQGAGASLLEFTGTSTGTFPLATGTGAALLIFDATGAGLFPLAMGTGAGTVTAVGFSGSGAGVFPLAQGSGASLLEFTGTSTGTFPLATGTGAALLVFPSTSGDGFFPLVTSVGAAELIFEATGAGLFPLALASGTGFTGTGFTGAGAGSFPLPIASSAGLLVFTGTADAFFPLTLGSGNATFDPLGCIVDLEADYDAVSLVSGSYKATSLLEGSRKTISLMEASYALASELEGSYDLLTDLDGGVC
jgi:hypothetical protein